MPYKLVENMVESMPQCLSAKRSPYINHTSIKPHIHINQPMHQLSITYQLPHSSMLLYLIFKCKKVNSHHLSHASFGQCINHTSIPPRVTTVYFLLFLMFEYFNEKLVLRLENAHHSSGHLQISKFGQPSPPPKKFVSYQA